MLWGKYNHVGQGAGLGITTFFLEGEPKITGSIYSNAAEGDCLEPKENNKKDRKVIGDNSRRWNRLIRILSSFKGKKMIFMEPHSIQH